MAETAESLKKSSAVKQIARKTVIIVLAAAIFLLGWGIGSGRLAFGPDAVYHRSVQKGLPANLDYKSVEQVYDTLKQDYDGKLDANTLLDGVKSGLAQASGDPYTEYFNAKDAKDFNNQLSGTFTGIGAELSKKDNNLVVVAPLSGFPAEKAGLKVQDVIIQINGDSTANMTITDAVNKIRGPKGTKVTLKVIRASSQQLSFDIVRDDIKVPSVNSKIMDNNIGYIQITQFSDDTSGLARKAASDFKQADVKGVVLDLRDDPGGLLDAAVNVSSLWLPNKTVLTERRNGQVVRTYTSEGDSPLAGIPTVVLINAGSASASEITAGALHDNGAATLIGIKSFGKGSVQQVEPLSGGAELKVTVARWYTPNGKNIDKQGIEPDKKIDRSDDDVKAGRDPQLDAATTQLSK